MRQNPSLVVQQPRRALELVGSESVVAGIIRLRESSHTVRCEKRFGGWFHSRRCFFPQILPQLQSQPDGTFVVLLDPNDETVLQLWCQVQGVPIMTPLRASSLVRGGARNFVSGIYTPHFLCQGIRVENEELDFPSLASIIEHFKLYKLQAPSGASYSLKTVFVPQPSSLPQEVSCVSEVLSPSPLSCMHVTNSPLFPHVALSGAVR